MLAVYDPTRNTMDGHPVASIPTDSSSAPPPIDTANKFVVYTARDGVHLGRMPIGALSPDEALGLAAWLVALSSDATHPFEDVLAAVQST